ncbi:DUF5719 family protein [Demequina zhanjiangensis]|uniref:DUF5719 family protein n=1 Tax=Demequina zhanjiangensis TaxID=3051659 RepID=A0ABT8FXP2_9MICO|nr:DUF5719 family protein [Demequina sp. SYSU T00b26]MDN4471674.1 DUF5719 family protein [Demequina sp. SYSU T00b26]
MTGLSAAAKAGTALVAGGVLVGVAFAGGLLDEARTVAPTPTEVAVTPAVQPAACTGPLTVPVGALEGDDFASEPTSRTRELYGASAADGVEIADGLFGASIERVEDGDIASLAALTCVRPATSQWLVGGSTAPGSSARLVLANPTRANVEATVTLYGGAGEVADSRVLAIGAGEVQDLFLEGIADGIDSLVARIDATGGGVVATIQDSVLDGLQPAGTSWVASTSTLGTSLVIPSVGGGDLEASSSVRLLAPDGATVSLTLVDEDGVVSWSGVSAIRLEPGVVTTVEVPSLPTGAVEIDSDAPLVAAAELTVSRDSEIGAEGSLAYDRTWIGAQPLDGSTADAPDKGAYAPSDGGAIVAYTPVATTLTVVGDDGSQYAQVDANARTVTRIPLDEVPAGARLILEGAQSWTLQITGQPGFIASMQPTATRVIDVEVDAVDAPYVP